MIKIKAIKDLPSRSGGVLRWVTSEDVIAIYGADWNTEIDDVADGFFITDRNCY